VPLRPNPLYAACVSRAAALKGGFDELGEALGVTPARLQRWADGIGAPPDTIFLKIVDLLLDDGVDPTAVSASRLAAKRPSPKAK
jgi:hypothetical protein